MKEKTWGGGSTEEEKECVIDKEVSDQRSSIQTFQHQSDSKTCSQANGHTITGRSLS